MKLTATAVKNAKPVNGKPTKYFDGAGLFLLVSTTSKRWRLKYRIAGKEKTLSIGSYPPITLAVAREKAAEARKLVAEGICPSERKQREKAADVAKQQNTFESVSRRWLEWRRSELSATTLQLIQRRLETHLFPKLGKTPMSDVSSASLLEVLRGIETTGKLETAKRCRQYASGIFCFAVLEGVAEHDPAAALAKALKAPKVKHHASITKPVEIGALLRAIDAYDGQPATVAAMRLLPLVFLRSKELRNAEWSEFDLDAGEWRISAERMKMPSLHVVPLATQAVAILQELRAITGHQPLVFPALGKIGRPLSENTINQALRRMDYSNDQMTGHGFRSMASTLLNEQGWNRDAIERQLAHMERDGVRAAYNYAEHLPERRKMMQHWADYLDGLKAGGDVVAFRRKREGK